MSRENRYVVTQATIAAAAGIGICWFVAKYRHQIFRQLKSFVNYGNPLRNQEIHIITNVEECRPHMLKLKA